MYNPASNSWEVISQMPTPGYLYLVAAPSDNQPLIVGGVTGSGALTNSVDVASYYPVNMHTKSNNVYCLPL